jgi:hypothetical protein
LSAGQTTSTSAAPPRARRTRRAARGRRPSRSRRRDALLARAVLRRRPAGRTLAAPRNSHQTSTAVSATNTATPEPGVDPRTRAR